MWKKVALDHEVSVAITQRLNLSGGRIDLSDVSDFSTIGAKLQGVCIDAMAGTVMLASFGEKSLFIDCEFANFRADLMDFGYSELRDCKFINCEIFELISWEATIVNCSFSGSVHRGKFNIHPDDYIVRPKTESAFFARNDFSDCNFFDVEFRGGIELANQRVPTKGDGIVVLDLPTKMARLCEHLDMNALTKQQVDRIKLLQTIITAHRQRDAFLSQALIGNDPPELKQITSLLLE